MLGLSISEKSGAKESEADFHSKAWSRKVAIIPHCSIEFRQRQQRKNASKKDASNRPRPDWNLCWRALTPVEKRIELCILIAIETEEFLYQQY